MNSLLRRRAGGPGSDRAHPSRVIEVNVKGLREQARARIEYLLGGFPPDMQAITDCYEPKYDLVEMEGCWVPRETLLRDGDFYFNGEIWGGEPVDPYGDLEPGEAIVECSQAPAPNPDWPQCCRNFTPAQASALAADRGVSEATISGLVSRLLLGSCFVFKWNSYCIAFPIVDETGAVFRAHCRSAQRNGDGKWDWAYEPWYDPLERPIPALIFGRLAHAKVVYIFESQWDAIALIDKLQLFPRIDSGEVCIVITRGARGVKRLDDLCFWQWADTYGFPQNDDAGEEWLKDVIISRVGCHVVRTPAPHKDLNDWTRDGATGTELEQAIAQAQFQQPERNRETGGVENGEFFPLLPVQWDETGEISPNSTGGLCQKAFYPEVSILADFYQYAITQSEGCDAYIIGAILPVAAALLGRNVWMPWSSYEGKLHPNIYSILAGPPGNLKSTSIYPAESIAKALLEKNRFLSHNYSPEALFDSFHRQPDRFLVCSDAGSTIQQRKRDTL